MSASRSLCTEIGFIDLAGHALLPAHDVQRVLRFTRTHVFNNNSHQRPVPPFTIILWIKTGYGSSDGIHALRGFIATSSLLIEIGLVETVLPSRFDAARQKRHSQLGYELMG